MKKSFGCALFMAAALNAQTDLHVTTPVGHEYKSNNYQLSGTLGQTATTEVITNSYHITQGYQQTTITVISLTEEWEETVFQIYPNPAVQRVQIQSPNYPVKYEFINIQGKIEMEGAVNELNNSIDLTALATGTYWVRINKKSTHQLIKK